MTSTVANGTGVRLNGHHHEHNGASDGRRVAEPAAVRGVAHPVRWQLQVNSPSVSCDGDQLRSEFVYEHTHVEKIGDDRVVVTPQRTPIIFQTDLRVPKLGVMLVGLGGNNGSTFVAGVLANRLGLKWDTRNGVQMSNWFGSLFQCGTTRIADDVFLPMRSLLPMVNPNELVLGGWDINGANLADAMVRARVLDYELQRQLVPHMRGMRPLPGIYLKDFIAGSMESHADHVLRNMTKQQMLDQLRADIRQFQQTQAVDKVLVLWTASTERFCDVQPGVNDTAAHLLAAIARDEPEISPSTLYAVAAVLEGCSFINGSPQNTFVPGALELAIERRVLVAGDDFKTGQTKFKSVVVDWLVGSGIKPVCIASYNHLGNNDGKNLAAPRQFRSKEVSKSGVVEDMVASNPILYEPGERPDHLIVIKYLPYVGDSKRALDEYTSEIFMGGHNTLVVHNTCEDSLLATPVMIDLVLLTELLQRVTYRTPATGERFEPLHPVSSLCSFLLKAPLVPSGTPVVNALSRQRAAIENFLRACVGLPPETNLALEQRFSEPAHAAPKAGRQ